MIDTRFIYIAGYLKETVTDSQVISWLELYQRRGIVFDLILLSGIRPYFRDKRNRRNKIAEAKKKLAGKVFDIFAIKPSSYFYQINVFLILFAILIKDLISGSGVVIQIRSATSAKALRWLKAIFPKIKIIYDVRGATAEEYLSGYQEKDIELSAEIRREYCDKLNEELSFLEVCDKAFCVSGRLKEYFLEKRPFDTKKFEIVPCCADGQMFFPDNNLRIRVRQSIGIAEDRLVLLYSGGLDKPWQIPDFIFSVFSDLRKRNSRIFLLCLTPHEAIVETYIEKLQISRTDIWSGYIPYQDINDYLNAADIGLLFRENTPTNNVASPTKFAEYLMAGLPTLISQGIGDLSAFVEAHKETGLVVDIGSKSLIDNIDRYLQTVAIDRKTTAEIGKKFFAKEHRLDEIVKAYRDLS